MKTYNLSELMTLAHRVRRVTGESLSSSLKRAWMLTKLAKRMREEIVEFYYIKKSTGEMRQAFGTMMPGRIGEVNGRGVPRGWDTVTYWDTEVEDYRCFKAYNLVKVD